MCTQTRAGLYHPRVCVLPVSSPGAGVAELCRTCLDRVWSSFLGPVVFYPLATGCMMPSAAPADALGSIRRGSSTAWPRSWMPSCESPQSTRALNLALTLALTIAPKLT